MIKRAHVRHFLALVDAGSFTQAAARIGVTQPTLSAGIAELERLVGTQLFVRDRKQLRLTHAGGRILSIARGLERDFRALERLDGRDEPAAPGLKFGILRSIATPLFERMVDALADAFQLDLVDGADGGLRAALAASRLHCAVTLLRDGEVGEGIVALFEEPYAMLVNTGHRLAGTASVDPVELASEVMIARRSCEILAETSRFFASKGVRPRFVFRSEDEERCLRMVARGHGMTTAPLSSAIPGTVPIAVEGYTFRRRIGLIAEERWLNLPGNADRFALAAQSLRDAIA